MNSEALFSMALGLHSPWQVKDVTFSTDDKLRSELHLRIDVVSGSRFLDEAGNLCPVHDTVERQWQHLSFFEHIEPIICSYNSLRYSISFAYCRPSIQYSITPSIRLAGPFK